MSEQGPRKENKFFTKKRKIVGFVAATVAVLGIHIVQSNAQDPPRTGVRVYGECGESKLDSFSAEPLGIFGETQYRVSKVTGANECVDMLGEQGVAKNGKKLRIGQAFDFCIEPDSQGNPIGRVETNAFTRSSKGGYVDLTEQAVQQARDLQVEDCNVWNAYRF